MLCSGSAALAQQDVDDAEHSIMRLWPEWFDSLEPSGEARPTPTEAVALMRALGASRCVACRQAVRR